MGKREAGRIGLALSTVLVASLVGSPVNAANVPPCSVADEVIDYHDDDWASVVVDTHWRLPSSYRPYDLVTVRRARIAGSGMVRTIVIDDLSALAAAARQAGVPLSIHSAYRSFRTQSATFRAWVREIGLNRALKSSARPGHSEHQLGTAIDFKSLGGGPPWLDNWQRTSTSRWLEANAWHFGFVLSYPKGTIQTTCYYYEAWHYRYVGRETAEAIHQSGQPPRVWLLDPPKPSPTPSPKPTPSPTPSPSLSPSPSQSSSPSPTSTSDPSPET